MQILTNLPRTQTPPPTPDPDAARAKVDQALELLAQTRTDNLTLNDTFEGTEPLLEGFEPHVRAIEFDRHTKDVSEHGTALREKADGATGHLAEGEDEFQSVKTKTEQMITLVEGALADLGESNRQASSRLTYGLNDLLFVQDSTMPGLDMALHRSSHLLGDELDPYLVEVEEDAPGRDVGRFADEIEEIWKLADQQLNAGPVYSRSAERSLESAHKDLIRAREAM